MIKIEYVYDLGMGHGLLNRIQNGMMKKSYRLNCVRMKKFRPLKHTTERKHQAAKGKEMRILHTAIGSCPRYADNSKHLTVFSSTHTSTLHYDGFVHTRSC